jgi:hypothetical protein
MLSDTFSAAHGFLHMLSIIQGNAGPDNATISPQSDIRQAPSSLDDVDFLDQLVILALNKSAVLHASTDNPQLLDHLSYSVLALHA